MPAVPTAGAREAVGQDAAREVATNCPGHVLWHAAAILVPLAGKRQVGLQMRLHRVVQRRALGAAAIDSAAGRGVRGSVHVTAVAYS